LTSCKPVSFSRRTLHHGVSKVARTTDKELLMLVCFCCPKLRRRSLPGMLLDTHEQDLMANDELLLTVLKASVPRLQNTDVIRSLLKIPDVFSI